MRMRYAVAEKLNGKYRWYSVRNEVMAREEVRELRSMTLLARAYRDVDPSRGTVGKRIA